MSALFQILSSRNASGPASDTVDVFLDLSGAVDAIITPAYLNSRTVGAVPGTWAYGPGQHDNVQVDPLTVFRHTLLRSESLSTPTPKTANGQSFSGATRAIEWDQRVAPTPTDFEVIRWLPGETVSGNTLVDFVFEMNRTLGADTGGTSVDLQSIYYGGLFAVAQQKTLANNTQFVRSHTGGIGVSVTNNVKYRILNFADKARNLNYVIVLNALTNAFIGAGAGDFTLDPSDTLTFLYFGDYLANGDGWARKSSIGISYNARAVLPSFAIPAPTSLAVTQTIPGSLDLSFLSDAPRFLIERSSNAGASWSTIAASATTTAITSGETITYVDSTVADATAYIYRVTPFVATVIGSSSTSSSRTVNNALYATPTWTDVIPLASATSEESNGAAYRQPIVCGTTGLCTKLRVGRRGGGSGIGYKLNLLNSSTHAILSTGITSELAVDGNYMVVTLATPVNVVNGTTYEIAGMPVSSIGAHVGLITTGGSCMLDFSTTYAAFCPNPYTGTNGYTGRFAVGMGVIP